MIEWLTNTTIGHRRDRTIPFPMYAVSVCNVLDCSSNSTELLTRISDLWFPSRYSLYHIKNITGLKICSFDDYIDVMEISFYVEKKITHWILILTTILLNNQMKSFILEILELKSIVDMKLIWISNQVWLEQYFTSVFFSKMCNCCNLQIWNTHVIRKVNSEIIR